MPGEKGAALAPRAFATFPRLEQFSLEVWGSPTSSWTRSETECVEIVKPPGPWDITYMDRENVWHEMTRINISDTVIHTYLASINAVSSRDLNVADNTL